MCLLKEARTKIAQKDLRVWKVFKYDLETFYTGIKLEDVVSSPAIGFDEGEGYFCFREKRWANAYQDFLPHGTVIRELRIPRGSRYRIGRFKPEDSGNGLIVCQAERLGVA